MDQLSLVPSKKLLSDIFEEKFKKQKKFTQVIENKQSLILITVFLTVPDIINFTLTCHKTHKLIESNATIQNKLLKAQVAYLTKQEEKSLHSNLFCKSQYHSAYSLIEAYYESRSPHIDIRLAELQTGKTMMQNSILAHIFRLKADLQKKSLQKSSNIKLTDVKKYQSQEKNNYLQKLFESNRNHLYLEINDDREKQLLANWQKIMSRQKAGTANTMKLMKTAKEVMQSFSQTNSKYVEINEIDESLILTRVTFWDRLLQRFI